MKSGVLHTMEDIRKGILYDESKIVDDQSIINQLRETYTSSLEAHTSMKWPFNPRQTTILIAGLITTTFITLLVIVLFANALVT